MRANFPLPGQRGRLRGTPRYTDHDDLVFAVGAGAPDTHAPRPPSRLRRRGATVSGTVNVTATASRQRGRDSGRVLRRRRPSRAADTTSPYAFSWVTTGLANGSSHSLGSKAYDAAGNVGTKRDGDGDRQQRRRRPRTPSLTRHCGAPKCAVVGISCDSGASLLLGRASLGPEPNQPNTIAGACARRHPGTFHSDESNDRIKVSTTDGSALAAGKTVRIDATVWAWTTPSADHLDLYFAANANSPTWTLRRRR